MVEGSVAAFAKAARVSDVPEEAITSDTREPSYMFLAAEWNRSTVSERAYLLAMLSLRVAEVRRPSPGFAVVAGRRPRCRCAGATALVGEGGDLAETVLFVPVL